MGIPSIKNDTFDLCITDPPYGIQFESQRTGKVDYQDNISFEWNKAWFAEVMRVSKGLVFTPGNKYHHQWIEYKKPDYQEKIWYKTNAAGTEKKMPLLFYGKIPNWNLLRQVIEIPINLNKEIKTTHPTPKPIGLWMYLLERLKPDTVLDPFMGSGTTAEACTKLGIKWYGYELDRTYEKDVNKRLKNISKLPVQEGLSNYV